MQHQSIDFFRPWRQWEGNQHMAAGVAQARYAEWNLDNQRVDRLCPARTQVPAKDPTLVGKVTLTRTRARSLWKDH